MPDIDHDSTGRQPVVCYVPAALHRRIKEQAARANERLDLAAARHPRSAAG
jgi:hypothetical protein